MNLLASVQPGAVGKKLRAADETATPGISGLLKICSAPNDSSGVPVERAQGVDDSGRPRG